MDGFLAKPVKLTDLEIALAPIPLRSHDSDGGADTGGADTGGDEVEMVLDEEALAELHDLEVHGGEPLLEQVVPLFLATAVEDLGMVRRSVAERRWLDVRAALHRLKGSSAVVGALGVVATCELMGERARSSDPGDLGPLLARLEREVDRAREALRKVAERNRASPSP
jgi:HPt (histidine-containing phosphotransfer) domain-containing protein